MTAVNEIVAKRMTKIQQMRWSWATERPFLDVRTAVLNGTLEGAIRRHYPGFRPANDGAALPAVAWLPQRFRMLSSTIVTSQVPVEAWHEVVGGPTLADAILDRLVHNPHRIELQGESMRRPRAKRAPASEALDACKQA